MAIKCRTDNVTTEAVSIGEVETQAPSLIVTKHAFKVNELIERNRRLQGRSPEEIVQKGIIESSIPLYQLGLGTLGGGVIASMLMNAPEEEWQ